MPKECLSYPCGKWVGEASDSLFKGDPPYRQTGKVTPTLIPSVQRYDAVHK
jgi:hypothetical protein